MQLSPKNQKRLAIDDQLGHTSTLLKMWQPCMRVTRLANSWPAKGNRD